MERSILSFKKPNIINKESKAEMNGTCDKKYKERFTKDITAQDSHNMWTRKWARLKDEYKMI